MSAAAIPVLTWHANNIAGRDYATNDHVALRDDLEAIHRLGLQVVSLGEIARALREGRLDALRGCVGLSFDDSPDLDYYDAPHPAWGPQRSLANILADFRAGHGREAQPALHATTFAIVSPQARRELDRTCLIGCGWWNDAWWPLAEATGLVAIESHGWDHNHETLRTTVTSAPRGGFQLASEEDADREIAEASRLLRKLRGRDGPVLFAYPYGDVSEYLAKRYFPEHENAHGVMAAFTGANGFVNAQTSPWLVPRFVCGADWKSPAELEGLLREASRGAPRGGVASEMPPWSWRDCLRTWEVRPAEVVAGELFRRCFGHPVPDYGRHFVLVYSPPPGSADTTPMIVAYVHWLPFKDAYLGGGMCVDERVYRRLPKALFSEIRAQGGLATIVTRESVELLGEASAVFGYVGEARARQADLRTGFVDTGRPNLMVIWRRALDDAAKTQLLDEVAALGPF